MWDSIHFYPDIHLIDNSELLQRRQHYLQELKELRIKAQENMEPETVAQISSNMQKLTEELDRLPNVATVEVGSPSKSYPEDSDSESYSPKVWRKNPLVVRKTKKAHDRSNGYPSDGSDDEWDDPKRRYKRKTGGSPKTNGRGIPQRSEMQEMFDKFEELKQKRQQLESPSRVPDPRHHGKYTENVKPVYKEHQERTHYTTEIHERLEDRREWFQQVPRDEREYYMDDGYMDVTYPDNVANKRKFPEEHMPSGALPRDQYDFRGHLPASHIGPQGHMTRAPHQYAQMRDDAPVRRISSFENIYSAVDLSPENPPMHRVDYEPRAKVPRHRDGQVIDSNIQR